MATTWTCEPHNVEKSGRNGELRWFFSNHRALSICSVGRRWKINNTCQLKSWRSLVIGNEYFIRISEFSWELRVEERNRTKRRDCSPFINAVIGYGICFDRKPTVDLWININGVPASDGQRDKLLAYMVTEWTKEKKCWLLTNRRGNLTLSLRLSVFRSSFLHFDVRVRMRVWMFDCVCVQDAWFQFFPYDCVKKGHQFDHLSLVSRIDGVSGKRHNRPIHRLLYAIDSHHWPTVSTSNHVLNTVTSK